LRYSIVIFVFILFAFKANVSNAQNTIGIIEYSSESDEGYTLFSPSNSNITYLIDNCGFIVNNWSSQYKPGLMTYLLDDGSLLKTARIPNSFIAGGSAGRVEKLKWDSQPIWSFNFTTTTQQPHHDIAPLPNGNFLLLLWDVHLESEAIQVGKNTNFLSETGELWSEKIQEIKPINNDSFEVVWEWNSWDHLIQDFDPEKNNFGVVADHPELFNINYPIAGTSPDWMHMNSIDYNPELDQISINSRNFNEFFIIDHSTTTEEAKGSSGGTYGKGGDILFRWGNPAAYNKGDIENQILNGQHDASWIDEGLTGAHNILVFNNNVGSSNGLIGSKVEEIVLKENNDGFYELNADGTFGPEQSSWSYPEEITIEFHSRRISGAQRLPNGNTLISDGMSGTLFEVTEDKNIVWKYINPVSFNGPLTQGDPSFGSDIFKSRRYSYDHPAFAGRDLSPMSPIELNPNPTDCQTTNIQEDFQNKENIILSPNPFVDEINLDLPFNQQYKVEIFNQVGQRVSYSQLSGPSVIKIDLEAKGIYLVKLTDIDNKSMHTQTMIKL